jgi:hypothetical protein
MYQSMQNVVWGEDHSSGIFLDNVTEREREREKPQEDDVSE